jgi:hypothetical protein
MGMVTRTGFSGGARAAEMFTGSRYIIELEVLLALRMKLGLSLSSVTDSALAPDREEIIYDKDKYISRRRHEIAHQRR